MIAYRPFTIFHMIRTSAKFPGHCKTTELKSWHVLQGRLGLPLQHDRRSFFRQLWQSTCRSRRRHDASLLHGIISLHYHLACLDPDTQSRRSAPNDYSAAELAKPLRQLYMHVNLSASRWHRISVFMSSLTVTACKAPAAGRSTGRGCCGNDAPRLAFTLNVRDSSGSGPGFVLRQELPV